MDYLKQNIWNLFYTIILIGLLLSAVLAYLLWSQTYTQQKTEQESIALLSSNSTYSILAQYESILELLGSDLLSHEHYKNIKESKKKFNKLLKLNPSMVGFGLFTPNGQLILTSVDKNVGKFINLLKKEESKESFIETLKSNSMVLGRTYVHETLKTYFVPIRKAIKDKEGKVLAVIVAGIKNQSNLDIRNKRDALEYNIVILRGSDYYRQLISKKSDHNLYKKPVPVKYINSLIRKIEKNYNEKIEDIKNKEKVRTLIYQVPESNEEMMGSIRFIKKYNLWVIVKVSYSELKSKFYFKLIPLVLSFVLIYTILFILFKQIHTFEKKKRSVLRYQVEHDYLTKMKNRYYLSKKFDLLESEKPFSLFIINIDNFKTINENFGHKCGDNILHNFCQRLHNHNKLDDVFARYSGDEFIFVRYNIDKEETIKVAESILKLCDEPFIVGYFKVLISASIGITFYPSNGKDFDELKMYADIALQEAKNQKNSYIFFEDSLKDRYLRQSLIAQELKTALDNNEIYMVYQPQIKSDDTLYGVEALVRWENKKLGLVPPDEFISIAESSGMMVKLGQYIIDTSLKEIINIQKQSNKKFQLSINISIKQFIEEDFYKNLLASIEGIGFEKSSLTLEITENLVIKDVDAILFLLKKIRGQQIKISLDDFGTGYSSLSLLKKLPIDELKIDKSFIDDIEHDEDAVNMVRSILLIGKQLNMQLLAEGIEKPEQKEILETYGYGLFQGYHFSKPLRKDALLKFL